MIESDRIILKKTFIMLDYARKHSKLLSTEDLNRDEFVNAMYDKFRNLTNKLSFKYRRRDEIPLRYLASKL